MTMYSSDDNHEVEADDGKIFQQYPHFQKASTFRPKGWTETVEGYINEAKQLTQCILRNQQFMGRPYTWAVHINYNVEPPPEQVSPLWSSTCHSLERRGVVAIWVREANRLNKVHYHLLVKNEISEKNLKQAIEDAMPDRDEIKWRKRVEEIENEWYYAHYMTKAKVAGYVKGRRITDLYAKKRLLFKANLGFKKYGVIGDFWEQGKTKKALWTEIKEREKRIADGLDYDVKRAAKYVHEFVGQAVPLEEIMRSFGYWSDSPGVRQWVEKALEAELDR